MPEVRKQERVRCLAPIQDATGPEDDPVNFVQGRYFKLKVGEGGQCDEELSMLNQHLRPSQDDTSNLEPPQTCCMKS